MPHGKLLSRPFTAISNDNFNERLGYDLMGNILRLKRDSANVARDQLRYDYTGNRLTTMSDRNTVSTSGPSSSAATRSTATMPTGI